MNYPLTTNLIIILVGIIIIAAIVFRCEICGGSDFGWNSTNMSYITCKTCESRMASFFFVPIFLIPLISGIMLKLMEWLGTIELSYVEKQGIPFLIAWGLVPLIVFMIGWLLEINNSDKTHEKK